MTHPGQVPDHLQRGSHPDRLPLDAHRVVAGEPRPPIGWQAPLLDLVAAVLRRWQIFLIVLTLGLGFGVARYLTTRPFFQSECVAKLMAREKPIVDLEVTNGSMQTGRDIAARGDTGSLMLPAKVDTYTELLRNDSVLIAIGERFASRLGLPDDLRSVELVHAMRDLMKVTGTEDGMITVQATAPDPALAADIANALVDEMREASKLTERELLTEQMLYLRAALTRARTDLEGREKTLADFFAEHDIVDLERQKQDLLSLIRDTEYRRQGLRQELIARLDAFTEDDHVARNLKLRIEELDADLKSLQARAYGGQDAGSLQKLQLRLENLRADVARTRDWIATLESQVTIFSLKIDEPAGSVAVLHRAIPVRQRAGPGKSNTIGSSILIAFVLGVALALLREQWDRVHRDPYLSRRAEEIRAHARVLAPVWIARRLARAAPRAPVGAGTEERP